MKTTTLMLAGAIAAGTWWAPSLAQAACGAADTNCSGGPARIMLIVDASSETLNDGSGPAAMGVSLWDEIGGVMSSLDRSPYDAVVDNGPMDPVASQVVHFGLTVVGDAAPAPGEQKVAVEYGPCTKPNVAWAMAPSTSCAGPGCTDPWAGPPITWTFVDGMVNDPPGFFTPTVSHMPRCDDGPGLGCAGSGRYLDLAVDLVTDHVAAYRTTTGYTISDSTVFANVVVLTGPYDSEDAAVQTALERGLTAGIPTYVVGYGPQATNPVMAFSDQLAQIEAWGTGNAAATPRLATNPDELFIEIQAIVTDLQLPCCARIDCSSVGGPDDTGGATGGEDANDSWGSASGSGGASDSADTVASDSMGSATAGSATAGDTDGTALDDDGGCTCHAATNRLGWMWLLLPLFARRRRRPRH
jgi:hypothetical protein